jgi:hypothetical protein
MNCLEFRRIVGAEPARAETDAELEQHARTCSACADFAAQMHGLDARIARALRIAVPRAQSRPLRSAAMIQRRFAMAASIAVAVLASALLWLAVPRPSLAADVIEHMMLEPGSWNPPNEIMPPEVLQEVSKDTGVDIDPAIGSMTYVHSCWFRGYWVPHLVVQDARGPVTVMILAHEHVSREQHFTERGFTGILLPAKHGAIAVLTRDDSRVETVAARVLNTLK